MLRWKRADDFDEAVATAAERQKPLFILFVDLPGNEKCRQMGRMVFSDMELVKQIEGAALYFYYFEEDSYVRTPKEF